MKLAVISHESYEAALEAFLNLSLIISKYKKIEQNYNDTEAIYKFEDLDKHLVELYAKLLDCWVSLIYHFQRSRFGKFRFPISI